MSQAAGLPTMPMPSPEARIGVQHMSAPEQMVAGVAEFAPLQVPTEMFTDLAEPVRIIEPDVNAGTAGVYRSRNAEIPDDQDFKPAEQSEFVATARVRAAARPAGAAAARGVATLAAENYVSPGLRGLLQMAHEIQLEVMRSYAERDARQYIKSDTPKEAKKKQELREKTKIIKDITLEDLLRYIVAAAEQRRKGENAPARAVGAQRQGDFELVA